MLNIGRKQKLVVVKKVEFGIYLGETREAGEKERVLLPIKQVPEGTKEGDELEVFLYRDSSDRLIATTREPKLVLGELFPVGLRMNLQRHRIQPPERSEHFWTGVWKKICFFRLNSRPAASIQVMRFWFPSTSTRATVSAQR